MLKQQELQNRLKALNNAANLEKKRKEEWAAKQRGANSEALDCGDSSRPC